MADLVLCLCGLAKHPIHIATATSSHTAYVCEHCDIPCDNRQCNLCRALYRATV